MVYELLLLAAIWLVASFPLAGVSLDQESPALRLLYQAYLLGVTGIYFVWFWRHGGQTLAMKTWRIRVVSADSGAPLSLGQAWFRYVLALLGMAGFGVGFFWALWDRDRQFLHDRLAGTRQIDVRAI